MASDPSAVEFYDRFATDLAPCYDKVLFEAVHGPMLHHLPRAPADVLDVGAGSGRDVLALKELGFKLTAVEPAANLRDLGSRRSSTARWIDDRLPELARVRAAGECYDFILCSAVLMSLEPQLLALAFNAMGSLLRRSGKLMVSVRSPACTDAPGILHDHANLSLEAAARMAGMELIDSQSLADALGRDHQWRVLVFQRP